MNLKSINQTEIKSLIAERLNNPEKYALRPLIIWRSDLKDGIQERILKEAFDEYNQGKGEKERKWYRASNLCAANDVKYKFTTSPIVAGNLNRPDYGNYQLGLIVIEPMFAQLKDNQSIMTDLRTVLNHRNYEGIQMLDGVPVVAFMSSKNEWFEKPEGFFSTDQYVFEPDFEEWASWAAGNTKIPAQVIDFIRGDGEKAGIKYRWYNYFNTPSEITTGRPGCDYPIKWHESIKYLRNELKMSNLNKFCEIPKDDFLASLSNFSDDLRNDFYDFVINQDF